MTEEPPGEDAYATLKARADSLEQQLRDNERQTAFRIRHSELKSEALRCGILDLDGLRLLDAEIVSADYGSEFDAAKVIGKLRQDKPWLFGSADTSSIARPPSATPARPRLATEMSVEEWRSARSLLLSRRSS